MSNAATKSALERIHAKLAEAIGDELDAITAGRDHDIPERLPANLITAVSAFLKNNEITADIGSTDDLSAIREKLSNLKSNNLVKDATDMDYLN